MVTVTWVRQSPGGQVHGDGPSLRSSQEIKPAVQGQGPDPDQWSMAQHRLGCKVAGAGAQSGAVLFLFPSVFLLQEYCNHFTLYLPFLKALSSGPPKPDSCSCPILLLPLMPSAHCSTVVLIMVSFDEFTLLKYDVFIEHLISSTSVQKISEKHNYL